MRWKPLVERVSGWTPSKYVPLRVALGDGRLAERTGELIGCVLRTNLNALEHFPDVVHVSDQEVLLREAPGIHSRSAAFQRMTDQLRARGAFPHWQHELFAAKRSGFSSDTLFHFHRGTGDFFGLHQFGTHLNGFVQADGRVTHVWIAQRSMTKKQWPGRFDTIVGGGLPANTSVLENMVKEAEEEASLPPQWTEARLVATRSISYAQDLREGLHYNTMFVFDLEMPRGVEPASNDGEVQAFECWPVADLVEALSEEPERFKPNICLVLLDFLVRHGTLTVDNFDEYEDLQRALDSIQPPYSTGAVYFS